MTDSPSLLARISSLVERETFNLPVLNEAGFKLQTMAASEECDMGEVERLIMRDQALAAEVLRAANSSFFGGLSEINTIRNAVMRVGLQQVIKMVFMVSERAKYQARDPLLRPMVQAMWRHASASAMAADWLARRLKYREREEAFLGALLHDIGELVLLRALDEFKTSENPQFPLASDLVEEILNSAHAELGHNFLKQRRIPEVYCRIARDHHLEPCDPSDVLMAIVRLADLSVRKLGVGTHADTNLVLATTAEAACLDVSEIMLAELEVMIEDNVLSLA